MVACGLLEAPLFSAEEVNTTGALPERLESRKKLYEEGSEAAVKPVKDRYRRDLEALISGFTRSRDLDASLAVSHELKTLDGSDEATGEPIGEAKIEPQKLVELRQNFHERRQRVQAPIFDRYVRDLKAMIDDFTQSRELEAALAVRSELERVELRQKSSDPDSLGKWLQNHSLVWKGQSGFVEVSFDQRMARVNADGREIMARPYSIKGEDTVEFEWSANDINSFKLSEDRNSFVRSSSSGSANHGGEVKPR